MKTNILNIFLYALLLMSMSEYLSAQYTVRGKVRLGELGLPVVGASVYYDGFSATTNSDGEYFIYLPVSGSFSLTASYNGTEIVSAPITIVNMQGGWMNFWFDPPDLPSDIDGNISMKSLSAHRYGG